MSVFNTACFSIQGNTILFQNAQNNLYVIYLSLNISNKNNQAYIHILHSAKLLLYLRLEI